ncbi:aspartate--tRNA ligase, partial [Candidatus Woesearchaeota archaeon]|nr:aspartate--tRNA ligase [Candidatus Woesearchaeota archaeon]
MFVLFRMLRTHTNGELTKKDVKKNVELCGWVDTRRDHGGIIFIDLRDRHGITQIVFEPTHSKKLHNKAEKLRREFVIQIKGKIRPRGKGLENPNISTGQIEVLADEMKVFSQALTPPIEIDDRKVANDDMRLKYRYLDLRRPSMQKAFKFRHDVITAMREYANKQGFLEIETPMLIKSTPEGARDYVVPSRINPGRFYALPQSPQLYKQIFMIAGFDKYYQIARCLRDEDLRADRQPEHTQFDFEMSFVTQEDIINFVNGLYRHVFKKVMKKDIGQIPIFTYDVAMSRFGSDKPDLRFTLELTNVTDVVKKSDFSVFTNVVDAGGKVVCVAPEKDFSRKDVDRYIDFCQKIGAKGMAWMRVTKAGLESNIAKFFKTDVQKKLIKETGAKVGSVLMFIADKPKKASEIAGQLRLKLGEDLDLIKDGEFKFCWVNDFPLFAYNEEDDSWGPEHHMFSMPKSEFVDNFEKKPGEVKGDLWDFVLNGIEIGSGSIRVSKPEIQERIMKFIGISKAEAEEKFGFLLNAYKYGGPPHGGMGLGLDRTVALMLGTNDIREVIAIPKNKAAQCPMDGSPGLVDDGQLKELNI